MTRDANGFERNEVAFLVEPRLVEAMNYRPDRPDWGGAIGGFLGVPVVSSPFIAPDKAIIGHFAGLEYGEPLSYEPDLYAEPGSSIKGYIQRKANALRADLGLELVNYAQEAEHERWRRHYEWASERFLMIHAVGGYSTNLLAGLGG